MYFLNIDALIILIRNEHWIEREQNYFHNNQQTIGIIWIPLKNDEIRVLITVFYIFYDSGLFVILTSVIVASQILNVHDRANWVRLALWWIYVVCLFFYCCCCCCRSFGTKFLSCKKHAHTFRVEEKKKRATRYEYTWKFSDAFLRLGPPHQTWNRLQLPFLFSFCFFFSKRNCRYTRQIHICALIVVLNSNCGLLRILKHFMCTHTGRERGSERETYTDACCVSVPLALIRMTS